MPLASLLRVLVADDHELTRFMLKISLQRQSQIQLVGLAANGLEAVELARKTTPHVLILDLQMPVMNGAIASQQIRQMQPEIKIIGYSTLQACQSKHLLESASLDALCDKTTEIADLIDLARKLTQPKAASRANLRTHELAGIG